MNPWQTQQQIRHLLRQQRWQGGLGDRVFGDAVFCYAGTSPAADAIPPGFPFAMVGINTNSSDPDEPSLLEQEFGILVAAEVAGDPLGEHVLIGGARPDDASSAGAGLGEVVEQARRAVQSLTGADGARVLASATAGSAQAAMLPGRHCAFESITLSVVCTAEQFYTPPQELQHAAGAWTWAGAHCEERFDFVGYRLGYVTGAVPATNFLDLEGVVYTGPQRTATHTAVPGRTYSVFAEYSPRGGTRRFYSPGNEVGAFLSP